MRRLLLYFPLLLPTYLLRFPLFGIPCTVLEVLIWGCFVIFLFQKKKPHPYTSPLILFLLAGTLSVLVSPDIRAALGLWKAYVLEPVMLFYVTITYLRTEDLPLVYRSFLYLTFGIVIVMVLQMLGFFSSPEPWISEIPPRFSSVFPYPNAVGLLLAPLLVLFFILSWYGGVFLCLVGIIASQSHGALLASGVTLLIWFLFNKKYIQSVLFSLLVTLGCVLLSFFHSFPSLSDNATFVRFALWKGSVRMLASHPWLGVGLAGFSDQYPLFKEASHTEIPLYAHQFLLDVWLQFGFLGFIAFFWLLFIFFSQKKTPLSFMMLGLLLYGLVDVPYFKNDLSILFWLILAYSILPSQSYQQDTIEKIQ